MVGHRLSGERWRPSPRATAATGVAAGATAGALGLWASGGTVARAELEASRWVASWPDVTTLPLEVVMQAGTRGAIVAVTAVLVATRRFRGAVVVGAAGWLAWAGAVAAKGWVGRTRPSSDLLGAPVRTLVEGNGYPSSHVAVAAALALGLGLVLSPGRRWWPALAGVALATALARVHIGAHWALDVVGGLALGVAAAASTHLAVDAAARRWRR